MEISEDLLCLFTAEVTEMEDSYQLTVPDREIDLGAISAGETYQVAVLPVETETTVTEEATTAQSSAAEHSRDPPVEPGDTREVEIDSIGDKGDGITRIDRGYVVIVPDTEVGDHVTVRIEEAKPNVAFAEVVDRHHRLQND